MVSCWSEVRRAARAADSVTASRAGRSAGSRTALRRAVPSSSGKSLESVAVRSTTVGPPQRRERNLHRRVRHPSQLGVQHAASPTSPTSPVTSPALATTSVCPHSSAGGQRVDQYEPGGSRAGESGHIVEAPGGSRTCAGMADFAGPHGRRSRRWRASRCTAQQALPRDGVATRRSSACCRSRVGDSGWLAVAAGSLVLAGLFYAAADSRTVTVAGDGRSPDGSGCAWSAQRGRSADVLRRRTRPDGRQGPGGRLRPVRRRAHHAAHRKRRRVIGSLLAPRDLEWI